MYSVNQYISAIYDHYDPKRNTAEEAMREVIIEHPEKRNPSLDNKVRTILKECKYIADHLEAKRRKETNT